MDNSSKPLITVVDDNPSNLQMIGKLLSYNGYKIDMAEKRVYTVYCSLKKRQFLQNNQIAGPDPKWSLATNEMD